MTPQLLTPPTLEPVTLDEAKDYLKIDHEDEDELIESLIRAARHLVEAASGQMLIHQTWRLTFSAWLVMGRLRLPLEPLDAIIAARVFDAAGVAQTIALSALTIDAVARPPAILTVGSVPQPGRAVNGIEIDVRVGHGPAPEDVPPPLRLAVLKLMAHWFENRGDATGERISAMP
ncbi:MAG: head-tail connector protein, partial [Bosea sp. (in: a-proteobacteria)]